MEESGSGSTVGARVDRKDPISHRAILYVLLNPAQLPQRSRCSIHAQGYKYLCISD